MASAQDCAALDATAQGRRGEAPGVSGPGLAVGLREAPSVFCNPADKPGPARGWGKGGEHEGRDAGAGASRPSLNREANSRTKPALKERR